MSDPIGGLKVSSGLNEFKKEIVEDYLKKRESFSLYPLRHYSQLELDFDPDLVKKLLISLKIPIPETKVTVFGGYTGQFASCLRNLGMKVVFTDPLKEWVETALDAGFEAYQLLAEGIPRTLIERTELFATFECYQPFMSEATSIYTVLRFLTTKYGILFAESKKTRNELKKEGGRAMLKRNFFPIGKSTILNGFSERKGI